MKYRNGFISNSSSASFIVSLNDITSLQIYGKVKYDVEEKLKEKVKKEEVKFDWNAYIRELKAKNEAYVRKQELIEQRRKDRIQKIDQTAKNTASAMIPFAKVFSVIVLVPVGLWLIWKIILGFGWCWYWIAYFFNIINWSKVLIISGYVGLVILGLAIAVGIGWLLFILFRKLFSTVSFKGIKAPSWLCVSSQWTYRRIFTPFGKFIVFCSLYIGSIIINYCPKFFEGIGKFFGFFWNMFMAWKNKNCPAIIWKD